MDKIKTIEVSTLWGPEYFANLTQPLILEQDGQPVGVLMSYETYQKMLAQQGQISAREARRLANKAVLDDLVGCALNCDDPIWTPAPTPHWRVPYRHFDGTLLTIVEVDAHTGQTSLTDEARTRLLEEVVRRATTTDVAT